MAKQYVLGLMFSQYFDRVALIRKNKPEWQAGKLNGIGGKIESGELPHQAMVREFSEEAGLGTEPDDWHHYLNMYGTDFSVECFAAVGDIDGLVSQTDEKIELHFTDVIRGEQVENLGWIISMAIDHLVDGRPKFATVSYLP